MESDIEFSIGADTSVLEEKMEMADAAFKRLASGTARYAPGPLESMSKAAADVFSLEYLSRKYNEALKGIRKGLREGNSFYAAQFSEEASRYKQFLEAAKKSQLKSTYISEEKGFKYEINSEAAEKDKAANKDKRKDAKEKEGKAADKDKKEGKAADKDKRKDGKEEKGKAADKDKKKDVKEEEIKQSEITDETKAQNREYNEHYLKLGKIHKVILGILAAWRAMKGLAGIVADKVGVINEARGALMTDVDSAATANVDRTYAMILRGIKNLGSNAPFSEGAYKSAVEKLQTMRENALTGQGVDEQYTIAVQQMNRMLGTDLNAEELLTGSKGKSGVEIFNGIMETVEKKMADIANMGRLEQSQLLGYLRTVLGAEIANGLMSNANKSKASTDPYSKLTALEKILLAGGAEAANTKLVSSTERLTSATSELKTAFDVFKSVLLDQVSPGLASFLGAVTKFTQWATNALSHLPGFPKDKEEVKQKIADNKARSTSNASLQWTGNPIKDAWNRAKEAGRMFAANKNLIADFKADKKSSEKMLSNFSAHQALLRGNDLLNHPNSLVDYQIGLMYTSPEYAAKEMNFAVESHAISSRLQEIEKKGLFQTNEYGERVWTKFSDPFTKSVASRLRTLNGDKNWTEHEILNILGTDSTLSGYWHQYFGEGGAYDANIESEAAIREYFERMVPNEYWVNRALGWNRDNTGERISGARAVEVEGGVKVYLDTTALKNGMEFTVPLKSKDMISELN